MKTDNHLQQKITKDYWLDKLSHATELAHVPAVKRNAGHAVFDTVKISAEPKHVEVIRELCSHQPVAEYTVFLAVYLLLFKKYFSLSDITISSVVADKDTVDQKSPLYFQLNDFEDLTFKSLILKMQNEVEETFNNKSYDLWSLLSVIHEKGIDQQHLSEFSFAYKVPGFESELQQEANLGIEICQEEDMNWYVSVRYNASLFSEQFASQILDHFMMLVARVKNNLDQSLTNIKILSPAEEQATAKALTKAQPERSQFENATSIVEAFEQKAALFPDQLAIVTDDWTMTYAELNEKTNQIASYLRAEYDIQKEEPIALLANHSGWMMVGMISILKSGGAYVPIDPNLPKERRNHIFRDACIKTIITEFEFSFNLGDHTFNLFAIDVQAETLETPKSNLGLQIDSGHLAYIVYTSGTTGMPKGVMIENGSLLNYANWLISTYGLNTEDSSVLLSSYAFDLGYTTIWGTMLSGATLHLLSVDPKKSGDLILNYLSDHQISFIKITPSLFYLLLNSGKFEEIGGNLNLRLLLLGGEKIKTDDLKRYWALQPETTIVNHYGPTETTIGTIAHTISKSEFEAYASNPVIGQGIFNSQTLILDPHNHLVPNGAQGELGIAGHGMARGYLNQPELTFEKFVQHPLEDGKKIYKTGDLAYISDDLIALVGRKDNQLKLRGYRVELGEIEQAVKSHKKVKETFVRALDDEGEYTDLVVYYSSSTDKELTTLKAFLKDYLPDYMIPSYFVHLNKLPINANGKIDIKALPDYQRDTNKNYRKPETKTQKALVAIWERVLGRKSIGIADDFFELGGHSLKATQLLTIIHQELEADISLNDVFDFPTILQLAKIIEGAESKKNENIAPIEDQEYYPISHAQRRLWVIEQFEESHGAYHVHNSFDFESLDRTLFEQALRHLVEKHEILRTSIIIVEGEPKQKVHDFKYLSFDIPYHDLSDAKDQDAEAAAIAELERNRPFDFSQDSLLRVCLLDMGNRRFKVEMNIHHVIFDGWSKELFLQEFNDTYWQLVNDKPLVDSSLGIQYKDYTCWLGKQLNGGLLNDSRTYWHKQLSGEIPILALPTDRKRPAMKTYNGEGVTFLLNEHQVAAIQGACQKEGATLFMGLLAMVKLLLFRYTHQNDLLVGSPIAGRYQRELENQLGFYANTLVLRSELTKDDRLEDLIAKVKETTLDAYAHQAYPFDLLIEELNLNRDMSRTPLFDVMVLLQNISSDTSKFSTSLNDENTIEFNGKEVNKFDLTFTFREISDGVLCHINYNTDLYNQSRIVSLIKHFKSIIDEATKDGKQSLESLEYLDEMELSGLMAPVYNQHVEYPKETSIQALFEEQVANNPEATAVVFNDQTLTYAELNRRANRLAHFLRIEHKIKPDDLIALMVDRSELMIVAILGILKAGGAYVPIDPDYPMDRKQYILKDSAPKVLIHDGTDIDIQDAVADAHKMLNLMKIEDQLASCSDENPTVVNKASDLAYVIYTSGSSGQPKGVLIEHNNVVRLMRNKDFQFDFTEKDCWTLFHSICFDFSVWEMYGALLYGGKLVVVSRETAQNAMLFADLLSKHEVTVLNQIPGVFNTLVNEVLSNDTYFNLKLRYVIFGGEALNPSSLKEWKRKYSKVRLINMYGITETTVHNTYKEIGDDEIANGLSNIGQAIPTVSLQILDEEKHLVPKGIVGEIAVGGLGVARGYLNRPQLTDERFITHPYLPGSRLYLSGDLGMQLENGELIYMGRKDSQVKIRGYRIELGEIENALINYEEVTDAKVISKTDANQDNYLVGYYTGIEQDVALIKGYLASHLPAYMVPVYLIYLREFPLTSNGKVEIKSLPSPDQFVQSQAQPHEAPTRHIEKQLAWIWEKILVKENLGIHDNFFDLGGNSLSASRLVTHIYKDLNLKINLRTIFNFPTIATLAQELDSILEEKGVIHPGVEAPLTSFQKQMWLLDEVNENENAKNIGIVTKLRGTLQWNKLQLAYQFLYKKHPILRTELMTAHGEQLQKLGAEGKVEFMPVVKLKVDDNESDVINRFIQEPIKLKIDPLFKAMVLDCGEDRYQIVLAAHVILLDKNSLGILKRDLMQAYDNLCKGESLITSGVKSSTVKDWWKGKLSALEVEKRKKYWIETLEKERPDLNFLMEHSPQAYAFKKGVEEVEIATGSLTGVADLSKKYELDTRTIVTSIINFLIFRYTGKKEFILWTSENPVEAATTFESALGPNEYTIPVIQEINEKDSLIDLVQRTKKAIAIARENEYPFEHMIECSDRISELHAQPEVMVSWLDDCNWDEWTRDKISGLSIENSEYLTSVNNANVTFGFHELKDTLKLQIEYNQTLIEPFRIQRMARHLVTIVENITTRLADPIVSLPYLEEEEKACLKPKIAPRTSNEELGTFLDRFIKQVELRPSAVAAIYEEHSITYLELNQKANQLAQFLYQDQQIVSEELVGVLMNKSLHSLIALLAVMKSGGAFIPIDGATPNTRIEEIIKDASIRLIISENEYASRLTELTGSADHLQSVVMMDNFAISNKADQQPNACASFGKNGSGRDVSVIHDKKIKKFSSENPIVELSPSQLAYCIYTSGSTGKQKGVLIEHGNLATCFEAEQELHQLDDQMVACHSTNYAFDVALLELLLPLTLGGKVAIPHHQQLVDRPDYLLQFMDTHAITDLQGTPTFINSFLLEPLENQRESIDLKHLRNLWIGGESLTRDLVQRLKKQIGHVSINNHYGPTEITIDCLTYKDVQSFEKNILGKPLSNAELFIVDDNLQILPIGIIGELAVGGGGVGRCYLNQVEMSEEKFVSSEMGRIYRTGDFGYIDEEGHVIFIGRRDEQVKVRGHRIDLGDIQKVLLDHPQFSDACVQVVETPNGDKEIAAYLQLGGKAPLELWPCTGTYPVYDDFLYLMMANDTVRNTQYANVINSKVKDKVVLEIGPGAELVLTLMCVRAGASKVYAIEWSQEAYEKASRKIASLGLEDKIVLIQGNALEAVLPEKVDVYVCEQIGDIGSAESAIALNNHALSLLDDSQQVIPKKCKTLMAAVQLSPHETIDSFNEIPATYAKKIFECVGNEFDLRVLLKNLQREHLITEAQVMEDLDFTAVISEEETSEIELKVIREGHISGFTCWIQLFVDEDHMVDSLNDSCHWLPMYFPVFDESVAVEKSDRIKMIVSRVIGEDGYHADYVLNGVILRDDQEIRRFKFVSKYQSKEIEHNSFYARLFKGGIESKEVKIEHEVRRYLEEKLPRYMVPTDLLVMKKLPLTSSGKVDRVGLKRMSLSKFNANVAFGIAPKNDLDHTTLKSLNAKLAMMTDIKAYGGANACKIETHDGDLLDLKRIEQKLKSIDQIKEASVIAFGDADLSCYLVGYYSLSSSLSKDALREHLVQLVPASLMPTHLVELNKLPLTSDGEVDHKVLEKMTIDLQVNESSLVAPRNYVEKSIVKIWNQVLHIDQVSIEDNFFDLGGHSIRAARISALLYDHFQVKISIKDIFDNPTVAQLAQVVKEAEELNFGIIEPLEEQEYYEPSHAQKRMWILDQIERDGISAYNMPFVWEMEGLDIELVQKSFILLLQRHESLRTTFVTVKGEPKQRVKRPEQVTFDVKYIDLRNAENQEVEARKLVNSENVMPFDLEKGPLLRCSIIQLDEVRQLFLLTLQHTVGDAWSMEVFENNYKTIYNSLLNGVHHNLEPLTIHYRDYSAWQNNFLELGNGKEDQSYWMSQFSDGAPVLQFPHDLPRPKVKTYNGDIIGEMLSEKFGVKLNEVSQKLSVSVTMLFMASVKAFLYKYTGQRDLAVGSPIIGRDSIELEDQIGFYTNTLAIRTKFDANDSFEKLVYKVRENVLDGFDHQLYPFDKLVEDLNFQRDLSRSPLFDIMVIHHNVGTGEDQKVLDGIEIKKFLKEVQSSKFDLTFNFADAGEKILFSVNYNTDLFTRERIEQVMAHFKELLISLLDNLQQPLNQLEYLTLGERDQIVRSFNDNQVTYDTEKLVHEYFEEQVVKKGDSVAVKFEDKTFTYSELNMKANQLAHYLRANYQIEEDSLVGVMVSRSEWLPVVLLGILKAGAAYVPIDPNYPVERNNAILRDANIVTLVTEKSILEDEQYQGALEGIDTIALQEEWRNIATHEQSNPVKITKTDGLFYLVYTSGSTGVPKAVAITHKNILSFLAWSWKEYAQSKFDVTYATTSYCFDLSVYEMFFTFSLGLPIRVLDSGAEIDKWLPKEENVLINTVPSVIQNLLDQKVDFKNINVLNMAGEPIPYAIKEQLDPMPIEVRNIYGPSEYASGTSCFRLTADRQEILIGKPLANTEILILNETGHVLPIGIKGEIYIGGDNLTRGYLNQPELTHAKFVEHPFVPGKKLFKSGDIGRWNALGEIEFFGRIDNQIKLRGYRIELGEIESVINLHPNVEMSIAEVKQNEQGESLLVGYYSGVETEAADFKSFLADRLPGHMIPILFMHMISWELTSNGKVDRKKLPAPQGKDFSALSEYKAPENMLQEQLVSIWKEVLNLEKVGIQDNFFESGGHSLNATQIISRIYLEFGLEAKLNLIFSYPTIEEMSTEIEQMLQGQAVTDSGDTDPVAFDSVII